MTLPTFEVPDPDTWAIDRATGSGTLPKAEIIDVYEMILWVRVQLAACHDLPPASSRR